MGPRTDLSGRVALVTGAARGMGRSHTLALAEEGADVVLCDFCQDLPTVAYPLASRQDLERTAEDIESKGRAAMSAVVDIRDRDGFDALVKKAVERFGHIDVLVANAGISAPTPILGGPSRLGRRGHRQS
ncbi:MAG TPA: SDR family NAD(P)-dependent oxidoreductase, partial [Acidimicrobiales bacterium]|nr:SDR family NAD(P)-dependent oxidoreductase [Acidimicrobiales bacterium]